MEKKRPASLPELLCLAISLLLVVSQAFQVGFWWEKVEQAGAELCQAQNCWVKIDDNKILQLNGSLGEKHEAWRL